MDFLASILVSFILSLLCSCDNSETIQSTTDPRPLPLAYAKFREIRLGGFLYIDKTSYLRAVLNSGESLVYVSRPRRFGKSVFLQMMKCFFRGEKELFNGLDVETGNVEFFANYLKYLNISTSEQIWMEFPVIDLDFSSMNVFLTFAEFRKEYQLLLQRVGANYGMNYENQHLSLSFLITVLSNKFNKKPVIVLVDEFDQPFQHALIKWKDKKLASDIRNFLDNFLAEMKSSEDIGLAYVTGVSKLPLTLLESGGNNFKDLTHDPILARAYGLTRNEIKTCLGYHLDEFCKNNSNMQRNDLLNKMDEWYDGYKFIMGETERVFNPISTIECLRQKEFKPFWCSTGSIKYVLQQLYVNGDLYRYEYFLKNYTIYSDALFKSYDPTATTTPLPIWMVYFGYATILEYRVYSDQAYVDIKYPNYEIAYTIADHLVEYVPSRDKYIAECDEETKQLRDALVRGNIRGVVNNLRTFGFRIHSHPFNEKARQGEITRRLWSLFHNAKMTFLKGVRFSKDDNRNQEGGDIDFLIRDLTVDYIISVKCSLKNATARGFAAMAQLIDDAKNHPKNFWSTIENHTLKNSTSRFYFLSLGFSYEHGGALYDWILIPYCNKLPQIDEIEVDLGKNQLRQDIKQYLQKKK